KGAWPRWPRFPRREREKPTKALPFAFPDSQGGVSPWGSSHHLPRFHLLSPVHLGIPAAPLQKLLMGSPFPDPPSIQDQDLIGMLHRRQAVGYDDHRTVPGKLFQVLK